MKKIILLLILFSIKTTAQTSVLIDKTFIRLKNDKKSFEQFVFYGYCNCTDKFLYTSTYKDNYITSFNHLEPFPRLFESDGIKMFLDNYQKLKNKYFENIQEKYYNGYVIITKCNETYNVKNKDLRKIYNNLISDKNIQKEWIDDYMKDYLDSYFIKIQTE
ncbi:hypothetical protein OIU80_06795 [Flavobacterium sp. LS1R47]|uniref:Uncharacterized protein n=1 Tax=Flavobacterium frigoritolerans TaxID=2987686 RepID=A0A9X2ZNT4_9FLAO|nr:hypothetical protein [Flavobacterium frigoritolerans]MCV9931986.1 hypothetical protein [Flavobacterium frigoritolerans]